MPLSINYATKVINVPQNYLTFISGTLYELNVNQFRLDLKDLEDNEGGIFGIDTHRHNTQVTLGGVTYARTLEIINGYTVTFADGQYTVRCVGANHNLADVKNANQVSLIVGNSAGLIKETATSGLTQAESNQLMATMKSTMASEPASCTPTTNEQMLYLLLVMLRNRMRIMKTTDVMTLYKADGTTALGTATLLDDPDQASRTRITDA